MLQYEKGLIDYQPVFDTQRLLVTAQDQVADSRGQVAVNLVAIYKALAGGWEVRKEGPGARDQGPGQGPVEHGAEAIPPPLPQ